MLAGENNWQIQLFGLFGEENFGEWPKIKNKYRKFEGENFGDWPSIRQIRQCFLLPTFSAIRYMLLHNTLAAHLIYEV